MPGLFQHNSVWIVFALSTRRGQSDFSLVKSEQERNEKRLFSPSFLLCQKQAMLRRSGEPFSNVWKQEERVLSQGWFLFID